MEADTIDGMKHGPDPHSRRRRPAEIIGHAVWLYHVVTSTKSSSGFQGIQRFLWRTVDQDGVVRGQAFRHRPVRLGRRALIVKRRAAAAGVPSVTQKRAPAFIVWQIEPLHR